jgi:hypothetical protein
LLAEKEEEEKFARWSRGANRNREWEEKNRRPTNVRRLVGVCKSCVFLPPLPKSEIGSVWGALLEML